MLHKFTAMFKNGNLDIHCGAYVDMLIKKPEIFQNLSELGLVASLKLNSSILW